MSQEMNVIITLLLVSVFCVQHADYFALFFNLHFAHWEEHNLL